VQQVKNKHGIEYKQEYLARVFDAPEKQNIAQSSYFIKQSHSSRNMLVNNIGVMVWANGSILQSQIKNFLANIQKTGVSEALF